MTDRKNKEFLIDLCLRMNSTKSIFGGEATGSDDAISSHAYEEAGKLSNPELAAPLITLIEEEKKAGLKTSFITILGYLLKNCPNFTAFKWIEKQLSKEKKISTLESLLHSLKDQRKPIPIDSKAIAYFINHEEYRLRDAAYEVCHGWHDPLLVHALNKRLEMTNDPIETPSIQAALSEIGDTTSFILIEKNLRNRSLHIRTSSKVIIDEQKNIK